MTVICRSCRHYYIFYMQKTEMKLCCEPTQEFCVQRDCPETILACSFYHLQSSVRGSFCYRSKYHQPIGLWSSRDNCIGRKRFKNKHMLLSLRSTIRLEGSHWSSSVFTVDICMLCSVCTSCGNVERISIFTYPLLCSQQEDISTVIGSSPSSLLPKQLQPLMA